MNIVESKVTPMRCVTIELPEERAVALKKCLERKIIWNQTDVAKELETLHEALGGWE